MKYFTLTDGWMVELVHYEGPMGLSSPRRDSNCPESKHFEDLSLRGLKNSFIETFPKLQWNLNDNVSCQWLWICEHGSALVSISQVYPLTAKKKAEILQHVLTVNWSHCPHSSRPPPLISTPSNKTTKRNPARWDDMTFRLLLFQIHYPSGSSW